MTAGGGGNDGLTQGGGTCILRKLLYHASDC